MDLEGLLLKAWGARESAYAPYSGFAVGAALLAESGEVFTGCNVENLSFGLSICAERAAVFSAITCGARKFSVIGIVADSVAPVGPCGACRQVLAEFNEGLLVVSENRMKERFSGCLDNLLPRSRAGILYSTQSST